MFKKLLPLFLLILSVSSLHAQTLPPANLTYTNIDLPGQQATFAEAINASGQIAGDVEDINGNFHGYRIDKDGSNLMLIDFPGSVASSTGVTGMNSRGDIVGDYTDTAAIVLGNTGNNTVVINGMDIGLRNRGIVGPNDHGRIRVINGGYALGFNNRRANRRLLPPH